MTPQAAPVWASDDWWRQLYDDVLADVLLERADPLEVGRTVDFIRTQLLLEPGDRLFDQCCGIGSLSIPFAQLGFEVFAVEQAESYVGRARGRSGRLSVEYVCGDAREVVASPVCDGAINWWTSFGYSRDDQDNSRMLQAAFRSLRPGARFLIDYMNVPGVLRAFQPEVVTVRDTPQGRVELRRRSRIDPLSFVMEKEWVFSFEDGRRHAHRSEVQLYVPHRLAQLLEAAGFEVLAAFGDISGAPLSLDSTRCILLGARP